ncbi:hypothetical protein ACIQC9_01310 [Brevundimonas sp. NPDC092305]|uniref:hypothetical protein n=1 Tax=Brevundimonas sp. NPDC092305 TaxID=3363957 RepID=UPI003829073A
MKSMIYVSAAAATLLLASSASAQVAGGLTGQVGGNVGVTTPPVGQVVQGVGSTTRDTVQGAAGMTRETVRDARNAARDARPNVNANADVQAQARADRDGAAVDAAIQSGAMIHSSDGAMLGTVTEVVRNTEGRATSFVMRTADGATRTVPAGSVSLDGQVLVTGWSESQFKAQ